MYLLDTNILIYFLKGDAKVVKFFENLNIDKSAISIVSRLEFLNGLQDELFLTMEMEDYLDMFENILLDKNIVRQAALLSFKTKKKLKFNDLIIAATSIINKKTLITADKDFQKIPGLKVKMIKFGQL